MKPSGRNLPICGRGPAAEARVSAHPEERRHSPRVSIRLRWRVAKLLLAVLLAAAPQTHAGRKKASDAESDENGSPTPAPPKFNVPIPVNHDAEGVNLPYFDNLGKLQMYFNIAKAMRVDLYHLAMDDAYMQTYDEKGAPDANVFLSRSVLDLNTRIVTSDVPVTVRRADFEIVGQKMVFNTQTRKGRMTGHVRMIIFNRQEMGQSSALPSPSGQASPEPSTAPRPSATPQS